MNRNFKGNRNHERMDKKDEFDKKVLEVSRVARTVKGGKRIRFRALVVVGNRTGKVGIGIGKASEVAIAVNKATKIAKKNFIEVDIVDGPIHHPIEFNYGAAYIILKPAKIGTSIIAGGALRTICELAGIKNIVGKILGTANKINNSKAMIEALKQLSKEK